MWAENGDMIRVIGCYSPENLFSLTLDDNEDDEGPHKARMMILEPYILIPTTQIVKAFPCARSAFLSHQFKGMSSDINYALVLGNVIHNVFQQILETMEFRKDKLSQMINQAMKGQLILLYFLKKTEEEVKNDVNRAIRNITCWLEAVFDPKKNSYGIKYEKFIAAE